MKKALIIGLIVILAATGVTVYWFLQKVNEVDKNVELSKQIPKQVSDLFYRASTQSYPYTPQAVNWGKKYFLLDEDAPITYNAKRNEALGTNINFPSGAIDGLVMVRTGSKSFGPYLNSSGQETGQEAIQIYYVVNYFDLKQKAILARDTIWGEEPKLNKRASEDQHGLWSGHPNEEELIESIKKRLK